MRWGDNEIHPVLCSHKVRLAFALCLLVRLLFDSIVAANTKQPKNEEVVPRSHIPMTVQSNKCQ